MDVTDSGKDSQLIKLVGVSNSKQYFWPAIPAQSRNIVMVDNSILVIPLFWMFLTIHLPIYTPKYLHRSVDCALSLTEDAALQQC
jgi:hypothetical protein